MTPLVPFAAGIAALVGAWLVLRAIGPRYRVGRLLAATPRTTVDDAIRISESGPARYVRIDGRIDAEDDFEDDAHRPLVLRRTRFQARRRGRWETVEDGREAVPFTVREGLSSIAIAAEELADGLVVIPRESVGTAGDVPDRVPGDLPRTTPVRAVIEQVSSVDHAIVLGVPVGTSTGPRMRAGLGRPLILTTLEPAEAMRVLAADSPDRPRLAAVLLAVAGILLAVAAAWWVAGFVLPPSVAAATPTPGAGGDPRSSGEGPGLVGQPLFALGAVIAIALVSAIATLVYVRTTGRRAGRQEHGHRG
ncbi:MAG TPA: hypothetical protein VH813_03785 [Candidatus Limnocylindrales bacterium]